MPERKKNSKRRIDRGALVYALILGLALVFISYLGFIYHKDFRESLQNQWFQQLSATEDIAALQFENYVAKFSANLVNVSHDPVVKQRTCDHDTTAVTALTYCPLSDLYDLHKDEVDAILLIDTNAVILRRFPAVPKDHFLGMQCMNRIQVEKLLDEDEVYISETFTNKLGKPAITISCPVFNEGQLVGILRWMVSVHKLADLYITPLRVGEEGYFWLVDERNVVRHHKDGSLIGTDFNDLAKNKGFIPTGRYHEDGNTEIDEVNHELGLDAAKGRFHSHGDRQREEINIYRKLKLKNQEWTLILTMPLAYLTDPIRKHALSTFLMEALILILFALFSYIFYRTQRRKSRLEVETKYLAEIADSAGKLKDERQKRLTAAIDGQEQERNRIARELHDGLGQYLVALKVRLSELEKSNAAIEAASSQELKELSVMAIEEVKRISENLMPRMLDEFGLVAALKRLCDDHASNSGITVDFVSFGITPASEAIVRTHLYRIAQEALSNIAKHSRATHVDVQLLGNPGQVNLLIIDNGIGFDTENPQNPRGNGLKNIEERTMNLQGKFELESNKGKGTALRIKVSIKSENEDE